MNQRWFQKNIPMILWTISFHVRHKPWSRFVLIFSLVSIHHYFFSSLIFFSVSVALMRAFCLYPSISPLCFMSLKRRRLFLLFFSSLFSFYCCRKHKWHVYMYTWVICSFKVVNFRLNWKLEVGREKERFFASFFFFQITNG